MPKFLRWSHGECAVQEFGVMVGMACSRRVGWSSSVLLDSVVANGASVGWVVVQGEFQRADHMRSFGRNNGRYGLG